MSLALSRLLVLVVSLLLVSGSAATAASPAYGPGIGADGLANTIIGGPHATKVSYRFRATQSAALESITIYFQTGSGYSAGDRGTIRIAIRADSGAPDYRPTGPVLAEQVVQSPGVGAGKTYRFSSPARLQAGSLYHVVFTNTHSSAASNYISINALFTRGSSAIGQPALPARRWAMLTSNRGGAWKEARSRTPIMALRYANGTSAGMGYMEVWVRSRQIITGDRRVRELFTVRGGDKLVSSVALRVKREAGQGALYYRLRLANGKLIEKGAVPARKIPWSSGASTDGSVWVTFQLRKQRRLKQGRTYKIVFRTKNRSTRYSVFAIREGTSYGYPSSTFFSSGKAQYWSGSRWRHFEAWGEGSPEGDLQFYFR